MSGAQNWGIVGQPWNAAVGNTVGNGGTPTDPTGNTPLDRARRGANQLGEAQYPAGYLGTYQSKQDGKNNPAQALLRDRLGERQYQRGIHRDTKQPQTAYYWNNDFNPDSGLQLQMETAHRSGNVILTQRFSAMGDPVERYMHGRAPAETPDAEMASVYRRYGVNPDSATDPNRINPAIARVMAKYLPDSSW